MASSKKERAPEMKAETLMLAYLCVRDVEGLGEKVAILDRFGLADSEIGAVCGVDGKVVRDNRYKHKQRSAKSAGTSR